MSQTKDLIEELRGMWCRCGCRKQSRKTFCGRCFYSLTKEHQAALYQRIGEGYEEAYQAAVEVLIGKGRIAA